MTAGRILAATLIVSVAAGEWSAAAAGQAERGRPVTFSKDIAPLIFDRCGICHHPEGSAPFSLLTYAAAKQRASLIARMTRTRRMPPWKSEPGYGEFLGQRHLSDAEIELIRQWVTDGAPEGDPRDLPRPPTWTAGWQLGKPDLVVALPKPFAVSAGGPNFSRSFILPLSVTSVRYVRGFEFHPGNSSAVHHANIRITTLKALGSSTIGSMSGTRGPGKPLFTAAYPDGHFLGWTPGQAAPLLPKGLAWRLSPGTDLVVEIHFVPTGKPELVQPAIGLFFTEEPPEQTPAMLRLGRQNIDIAPGQRDFVSTDTFVLPVDVEVLAVQPHAHYRAREVRGTATLPDGTTKPLIYIKDWDFLWQHVYRLVKPLALPKGTTLAMRITYDNSADNPRNPQLPPARVRWGQQSIDEMGDIWIQMLTRSGADLRTLTAAIRPKLIAEDVVGYEAMSRSDPNRIDIHNDLAVMYDEIGRLEEATAHLAAVVRLQPGSAQAHYNLGTELAAAGQTDAAIERFRQALRIRPDYALAHNNLGHALVKRGAFDEALAQFREAARLEPGLADARYNIGTLVRAAGRFAEAIEQFREAVRLQPDWLTPLGTLAWELATVPDEAQRKPEEARRLAERAVELTDRRDARVLDILAAALAAGGEFEAAIAASETALGLDPAPDLVTEIRERQALYRQRRAYLSRK